MERTRSGELPNVLQPRRRRGKESGDGEEM
jgi:hypothetical protein